MERNQRTDGKEALEGEPSFVGDGNNGEHNGGIILTP